MKANHITTHAAPGALERIYVSAQWRDREAGTSGCETMPVDIPASWSSFLQPKHLNLGRLTGLVSRAPDHLFAKYLCTSRDSARHKVCVIARSLQFIYATGLVPSDAYKNTTLGDWKDGLPRADHTRMWFDQRLRAHVATDEPYIPAVAGHEAERAAWAQRNNREVLLVDGWRGVWSPEGGNGTCIYLVADRKKVPSLRPYADALKDLPLIDQENWVGISGPLLPPFVSPGERAAAAALIAAMKTPKPPTPRKPRKRVAHDAMVVHRTISGNVFRRPNSRMPIEVHAKVGATLKSVYQATCARSGAHNRVDVVRCMLDAWAFREYAEAELPAGRLDDLYYRNAPAPSSVKTMPAAERQEHIVALSEVKATLAQHYPDCMPLREVLQKVDGAIKSLRAWGEPLAAPAVDRLEAATS